MNAGKDKKKALEWAQENANRTEKPRYVHSYGGSYWIGRKPSENSIKIEPKR